MSIKHFKINRCRFCPDCGILFCYDDSIEGYSEKDRPCEPCPNCGNDNVFEPEPEIWPWGGVVVIDNEEQKIANAHNSIITRNGR